MEEPTNLDPLQSSGERETILQKTMKVGAGETSSVPWHNFAILSLLQSSPPLISSPQTLLFIPLFQTSFIFLPPSSPFLPLSST